MKDFDVYKFVKLLDILNKKKNYSYFSLRCKKNIKDVTNNGNYYVMKNFMNQYKNRILNDSIKYKVKQDWSKLYNSIEEAKRKIIQEDPYFNEVTNFESLENGKQINMKGKESGNSNHSNNLDLLIYITYANNERLKQKKVVGINKEKNERMMLAMQPFSKKNIYMMNRRKPLSSLHKFFNEDIIIGSRNHFIKDYYKSSGIKEGKRDECVEDPSSEVNKTMEPSSRNPEEGVSHQIITNEIKNNEEIITEDNVESCAKVKITKENIININEIKKEGKKMKKKKNETEECLLSSMNENGEGVEKAVEVEENSSEDPSKEMKEREQEEKKHKSSQQNTMNFQMKNSKSTTKCLYPHEIVEYLNKYIIGQTEAKKVVANALRQRWRRIQVDDEMKKDIIPKNILMIGPTGVGKTEIARRISMFLDAPFIKVEATKFTEVGFHGKDVDQIIKDLVEIAVRRQKTKFEIEIREQAEEAVENIILYSLLGNVKEEERNIWRKYLREGSLDDKVISFDLPNYVNNNYYSNDSVENAVKEALSNHQNIKSVKIIHQNVNKQNDKKTMTIREAKQKLLQMEIDACVNQEAILKTAIASVEEEGIVFIDEIDKICSKSNSSYNGPDASAEGVQRDLLPLIEGCVINTKYGNINTSYILFIASGAFQRVKPNDMLNELQGRLPVQVTLSSLTIQDFIEILTKTHNNLIQQNIALLKTEGIDLQFTEDAIETIANCAHDMNFYVENIGVRRLHTILEKIMEEINYDVINYVNKTVVIDKEKVKKSLEGYIKQLDLKKYII